MPPLHLDEDRGGIPLGLVYAGLVLWRFSVVFLLFHGFFLICFALISFQLRRFLGLVCAGLRPLCAFG